MKQHIIDICLKAGAVAVGIAAVEDIDTLCKEHFSKWISRKMHAGMDYMERHADLRSNPKTLLEDAQSVICVAFSYHQPKLRDKSLPLLAPYAYGRDYHKELRSRLKPLVNLLDSQGYKSRICIDSAPIAERYWALKSGIGRRCDNGCIAIDGYGSEVFLAEVLTTLPLPADRPSDKECLHCGLCLSACPTGALQKDSTIDCRRCMNYLTIEHHTPHTAEQQQIIAEAKLKHKPGWFVGCDICQRVCPLNRDVPSTEIEAFLPRQTIIELTPEKYAALSDAERDALLNGSPLRRALKH